ncbi:hypothetical protein BTO18_11730 [Polaribacter porphyrae]|uniref:Uncharacterized protein n=1 Tax=Polaribacter porphyrae TaxID=1137780 RepID=A0A2S7WR62_9FLAO|nr:hypothetical protein BTO18_11730 [Polaribacter porphyrae]
MGITWESIRDWLVIIAKESKNHIASIIIIILLFFLLWFFLQTRDLLVVLNQPKEKHLFEMILFFSSITILSFLISNVNDYFYGKISLIPRDNKELAFRTKTMDSFSQNESDK